MPGPDPAVAATRLAVRRALSDTPADALVLVGVSGGADSLALAAAAAFELPKRAVRVGAVVVDHALQGDSAQVAATAARRCGELGLDPVRVIRVDVAHDSGEGPESAARVARHRAFSDTLRATGADYLLLGHTKDDQAETVLMRMARGSGIRALAGMAQVGPGVLRRPFLATISRAQTRAACVAQGISWWDDPHNDDPRYTRVRARRALALLSVELGPGLVEGLARTATLARQDADHLDQRARFEATRLGPAPWPVADLRALPDAVRSRVWRVLTAEAGAVAADVSSTHVAALEALVTAWHGQGPVDIPGRLRVRRRDGVVETLARPVE